MPHSKRQPWLKSTPRKGIVLSSLAVGIEYWRKKIGALKMDIAKKAGISAPGFVMLTRGARAAKSDTVDNIAKALGVSTAALYARVDDDILDWVRDRQEAVRGIMLVMDMANGDLSLFRELGLAIEKNEKNKKKVQKFLMQLRNGESPGRSDHSS